VAVVARGLGRGWSLLWALLTVRSGELDGVISFLGVRHDPCRGLGIGLARGLEPSDWGWRWGCGILGGGESDKIGDGAGLMMLVDLIWLLPEEVSVKSSKIICILLSGLRRSINKTSSFISSKGSDWVVPVNLHFLLSAPPSWPFRVDSVVATDWLDDSFFSSLSSSRRLCAFKFCYCKFLFYLFFKNWKVWES